MDTLARDLNRYDRELEKQDAYTEKWGFLKMQSERIDRALNMFVPMDDDKRLKEIKDAATEILGEIAWKEGER